MSLATELAGGYCPYCGEPVQLVVDNALEPEVLSQQYIEDCQVCCRPMQVETHEAPDGTISVVLLREDD